MMEPNTQTNVKENLLARFMPKQKLQLSVNFHVFSEHSLWFWGNQQSEWTRGGITYHLHKWMLDINTKNIKTAQ